MRALRLAEVAQLNQMSVVPIGRCFRHGLYERPRRAGPIGGMFPAPNGTVCAAFLRMMLDVNYRAFGPRGDREEIRRRFDEVWTASASSMVEREEFSEGFRMT